MACSLPPPPTTRTYIAPGDYHPPRTGQQPYTAGVSATATGDEWQSVLAHYDELIGVHGVRAMRTRDFARWLAATEHASWIYPSTSMAALGLSTVRDYPERLRHPMVFLADRRDSVVVTYQLGRGLPSSEEVIDDPRAPDVMTR